MPQPISSPHTQQQPHQAGRTSPPAIQTSSSVQEIISRNPGYLVRHGTLLISGIICLLIAGMYFIRYPDTLEGPVVLTTDPLPIKLKSSAGGRIFRLFVKEGDAAAKDQPIAEIENSTGLDRVQQLSLVTDSVLAALNRKDMDGLAAVTRTELTSLGEAQPMYNTLLDAISAYTLVHSHHIYAKRNASLQSQLSHYRAMSSLTAKEKAMIDEEFRQADERFKANEKLYSEKIISRQEYFDEAARLRQKKMALEEQKRSGLQNSISLTDNSKQLLDMAYEQEEKENSQMAGIKTQVRNLQNFVQNWKLKYLLYAPYPGRVHFLRPLQVNETMAAGEEVCTIVPAAFHYTAYMNIPAQGSGKVQQGQAVHLLLDQFPYNEYGYLRGKVSSIATLPQVDKSGIMYRVSVTMPDSLYTSYKKHLPFNADMTGTGRVITNDRSLLQRIFSSFTALNR